MEVVFDPARLERSRRDAILARSQADQHQYFHAVAQARYSLRKVFRLIEEEAKRQGIDPLAHQALIQIYGAKDCALRVKDLAERLDISPAFASSLAKMLLEKGYVKRRRNVEDKRSAWMVISAKGKALLHAIDEQVQVHVDYFNRASTPEDRQAAVSILLFYVGVSLRSPTAS